MPLAGLIIAGGVLLVGVLAFPFTVDDAYITARYARRLLAGQGYGMGARGPSDGVTGPLWLLPGLAGQLLGGSPVLGAKLAGLSFAALGAALPAISFRGRAQGRSVAVVCAAVLVVQSTLGIWGAAGLGTGAAILGFALALGGVLARPRPAPKTVGVAIAALAWLRPELALASGALLVRLWLRDRRSGWLAFGIASTGVLLLLGFRLVLFGDPLPLSFYAKPADLGHGVEYLARGCLFISGLGGLALVAVGFVRARGHERTLHWALAAHALALWLCGGDWMPGFRLFAPLLPAYALAAALGFVRSRRTRSERLGTWIALGAALAVPALELCLSVPQARASAQPRERRGAAIVEWLGTQREPFAMLDVGYFGYATSAEVVDLGGITDPEIAHLPGGHIGKRIPDSMLRGRKPGVILLHSERPPDVASSGQLLRLWGYPVERRIARSPVVRTGYRVARVFPYHPSYYYVALVPRSPGRAGTGGRHQ